jgi:hypothetical protein
MELGMQNYPRTLCFSLATLIFLNMTKKEKIILQQHINNIQKANSDEKKK